MRLGGMMLPSVEEAAVTPTAKPLGYPSRFIAGIMTEPTPIVSAEETPEMPAKIIETPTFTWARPPRR